ncbi:MAG: helix-turn-helix domain-containing protein [Clostridia bacterium]|nr:helix-turn-helix domain-containing protein [Clostridia bacterium]
MQKRQYAAISYKISGEAEFEIMNKKLTVKQNDIVFIPANMDYKVTYTENDSIIIHITDCNYDTPEIISFENKAEIEYLFFNLLNEWKKNHSVNQAKSRIYDIFFNLSEEKRRHNRMFEEISSYMEKNFSNPDLGIDDVCRHFFISRTNLQRIFLKCVGISPKQYLLKLKLEKSFRLLKDGEMSIKEIALSCGFADEKYFSRVFREKIGCPPSHFTV